MKSVEKEHDEYFIVVTFLKFFLHPPPIFEEEENVKTF
jgi:hypothetical protein